MQGNVSDIKYTPSAECVLYKNERNIGYIRTQLGTIIMHITDQIFNPSFPELIFFKEIVNNMGITLLNKLLSHVKKI
jgi:hypothetical protein